METAIKKAIEGGWRCHAVNQAYLLFDKFENIEVFVNGFGWVILYRKGAKSFGGIFQEKADSIRIEQVYSDRTFWQALGKACGWELVCRDCENGIDSKYCKTGWHDEATWIKKTMWKYKWHKFIDHLAEGKDAESFFKELFK